SLISNPGQAKDSLFSKITITPIGVGKYVGWQLDGNRRFLLGDFTVTHNSGKTCMVIKIVEQIRSEGVMLGALYLAKGEALVNNFVNELIFKCTDGRYKPKDYDDLTALEKVHRQNKLIGEFYTLNTFETFAGEISKIS